MLLKSYAPHKSHTFMFLRQLVRTAATFIRGEMHHDELLREIHNTNAASNLAFMICNSMLALKKQHVKRLKEAFDVERAALLEHERQRKAGEVGRDEVFHFTADLDGANACPPEDVGGPPGYMDFLQAVSDPKHPEHRDMIAWHGGPFDPRAFNLKPINARLARMKI